MIHEMTQTHYLGVLCSRCKQPIAVSKRVAALFEELKRGELSDGQDVKSRAYTLRCKACNERGLSRAGFYRYFGPGCPESGRACRLELNRCVTLRNLIRIYR
jgi:phage FluMu protein Com